MCVPCLGHAEAHIRRSLVRQGYIKGIIGLPANLFYSTGIPACIVVLDKENAHARRGIFMIDASRGFMKAGNKNRLRNQDYGRIHAWDRGTTLLAHGQLRGDVDSGKNGILKGNVQNRMMEVREVALEMVPSETDERVPPLALRETSLWIYPVETALVTMYGGFNRIGRTGLLKIPAAVNQANTAVQSNGDKLDADYLLPMLDFNVAHWKSVASSSLKDPNLTSADIRAFRIAYPEIAEQRAIAAALSDADVLISSLNRRISKKHAVMQQLLTGKQRLPGFGYSEHSKKTAIGELSDDWDCHSVQDLAIRAEGTIKIGPFDSQLKWNCSAFSGVKRIATLAEPKSLRRKLQEIGQDNHEYVRTHFRQSEVTRLVLLAYHEVCG